MIRRVFSRDAAVAVALLFVASTAFAVVPPRDGGPLPDSYFKVKGKDPSAFTVKRGWVQKAERLREAREAYQAAATPGTLTPSALRQFAVTGTLRVPVIPGYFSDALNVPVTAANLQNQLFDSNATGTVGDYYSEVSYGQFTVVGDVYTWVHLTHLNSYYAGNSNGTDPSDPATHFGEFIKALLDARDATINFAQYDNDGPDGIPNSGDDDGYVDALVVVQSLPGYECDPSTYPNNIQSHEWRYSVWPVANGLPYQTNDPAAGGGFIKIDDYVVGPALNCSPGTPDANGKYPASGWTEIGVYCHELGHTFGLPDLYDIDGGGYGIGDWGIMGTGVWNTPEKPAHEDAWCRMQLGWLTPTEIGWQQTPVSIPDIEENAVAYKLPFTDERFRRSNACVIAGAYSLYCGLPVADGAARGYLSPGPGGGYGSNWYQTVQHDFHYSGAGSVTFQYKYRYDTEPLYDYCHTLIEVNGVESEIATYNGLGTGTASHDITSYLAPLAGAGGDYMLKFRFTSDYSFDDADGQDPSDCGAWSVDDVSVNGGGESYATGFETYADGWYQDPAENPVSEYWLVENRRAVGFDQNLHGQGLLIWHVDDEVLRAPFLVNSGFGNNVRGLVLDEADGMFNLNHAPLDKGSAGDPYPGTTNNTTFNSLSSPSSLDNTQRVTQIAVLGISAAGPSMTATMRAGDRGPTATAASPNAIDNDQVAAIVDVGGTRLKSGATFRLVKSAGVVEAPSSTTDAADIVATSLEWIDPTLLRGTVNVYSKTGGPWDLIVTNPDGQVDTLSSAVTINQIVATQLRSASIRIAPNGVQLQYELAGRESGETLRLSRSEHENGTWTKIADDLKPDHGDIYLFTDTRVEAGKTYFYLLESVMPNGDVREINRGTASVPARDLVLDQNYPNPFNPRTSIRFYLPARVPLSVDVFDVRGALVRRLAEGTFDAGTHVVTWDGTDAGGRPVASGMYVYRLTADRRSLTRKMMLLK